MLLKKIASKLKATGFFHIFTSTVLSKVISFASGIVLVKIITKSDYGVFSYANNILNFFMILAGLGAVTGILQLCSEQTEEEKKAQLYGYGCRISMFSNFVLSAVIIIVAVFIPLKIEGSNTCLLMMAFLPLVNTVHEIQRIFLRTQLRNKEYSVANIFSSVVVLLFSASLSWFFSTTGLIAAKYLSAIIGTAFIAVLYKVYYPVKKVDLDTELKKIFWKCSLISMMNNGFSQLMYLLDIFVLGNVLPDSEIIASYKVATNIPTALAFIPAAIITYVYPYFARNKDNKKWVLRRYGQISLAMAGVCFVIAGGMIIFAPFIIKTFFSVAYADSIPVFRVLCVSFAFSSVFRILPGNILTTQRKLTFNLFVAIFSSGFNTVLNVFLINAYGSIGAAYATLITVIVTGLMNVSYLLKTLCKKDIEVK